MAPRTRKTTPKKEEEPVTAEEYVETEEWDGVPDDGGAETAEELEPKKRGRQVSPLIVATREYEKAHKTAEKCRKALSRVKPLADAAEAAEKEETAAYERLQAELAKLSQ